MYLPSFYKFRFEKYFSQTKKFSMFAIPLTLWVVWTIYPHLYNTVYTDFIPPQRGVKRRIIVEQ